MAVQPVLAQFKLFSGASKAITDVTYQMETWVRYRTYQYQATVHGVA